MTDPRLTESESSLGKACKHEWQCDSDTQCDGGEADEVHGNIGASGVEVLTDEHDIIVDIQQKISAEEPFPWEELLQQVFGRIGGEEKAHLVVIALHYDNDEQSLKWVTKLVGKELDDLMKTRGLSSVRKLETKGNAMYVFRYDERHYQEVPVVKEWTCGEYAAGIYMRLKKEIRHDKNGAGRFMNMGYLSVNLEHIPEGGRKECLDQMHNNIRNVTGHDEMNTNVATMIWSPGSKDASGSTIEILNRAGTRQLFPAKARRSLAASAMRRLLTASAENPVCLTRREVKAVTKALSKEDDAVTTWMKTRNLFEGRITKNEPPAEFNYPGGNMRTTNEGIERCFVGSTQAQNAGRIVNKPPRNKSIYRVNVKDQSSLLIPSAQSANHSIPRFQINLASIFEYESPNYEDAKHLLIRGNDADDDSADWVQLENGTWLLEGVLFWNDGPVCDGNRLVGEVVCKGYGATHYRFRKDYKTKHEVASISGVNCTGKENKLEDCEHDERPTCNLGEGNVPFLECYYAENEAAIPENAVKILRSWSDTRTPHGVDVDNDSAKSKMHPQVLRLAKFASKLLDSWYSLEI